MMNNTTAAKCNGMLDLDSPYVRSFASEAMLLKKIEEYGINTGRHQIVRTPKGRWTALVIGFRQELLGAGWPMIG